MTRTKTTADAVGGADPVAGGGAPLIEIARAYLPHEALLAVALLRAEGIWATAFDGHTHVNAPNYAVALGGMRVMVPEADAARAADVLAQVPQVPTRRPPLMIVILIALTWYISAPPVPGGLFVRRPQVSAPAGS